MSNGIPRARVTMVRADAHFLRDNERASGFSAARKPRRSLAAAAAAAFREISAPFLFCQTGNAFRENGIILYISWQTSNLRIASVIYHSGRAMPRCVIPAFLADEIARDL